MPIDSSIALQTQAPQIQMPLQAAGQFMALKNAGLQQQMGQQQLQQGQYALNLAGQQEADKAALATAVTNNTVTDPHTGMASLNRAGFLNEISKTAPRQYLSTVQTLATNDLANAKARGEADKLQYENQANMFKLAGQIAGTVHDQASWDAAVPQLERLGAIQPGQAPAAYDPDLVQRFVGASMTAVEHLTAQQKAQEMAETARNHKTIETETARRDDATAVYQQGELAQGKQRNSIEGGRLGLDRQRLNLEMQFMPGANPGGQQLQGEAYLKTLNPAVQGQVRSAANGDIELPSARSSPAAQMLRTAVMNFDPSYTDSRYTARQSFKSGPDSQTIVQLATAMEHADNAKQHSSALGYAPLIAHNATTAAATYNKDVQYLTGEVGKLVKNGVLGEKEAEELQTGLNSPRQGIRDASLDETMKLLGGKVGGIFQKYKTGTGQELPVEQFFDAPTQERLKRFGVVGGGAQSAAPQGGAAPEGTRVHMPDGSTQVKQGGNWVKE